MVYSDSAPVDYVNDSAYEDPDLYGATQGEIEHYRVQAERLAKWFPPDTQILDIGSATGGLLKALKRVGFVDISGYDLSSKARENCRKMGFTMHDRIPEGNDLVVLSHVLEHVHFMYDLLGRVKDAIRPGGMAYIEVPDVDGYSKLKGVTLAFNPEHINHFSKSSLRDAIVRSGLRLLMDGSDSFNHCGERYGVLWAVAKKRSKPEFDSRFVYQIEQQTKEILARVALRSFVAVWGLGMLAKLIFKPKDARMMWATDSNPIFHGKYMFGVKVVPPEQFKPPPAVPIVVCSQLKIDEIVSRIKELGLPNELITFPVKP